VAFKALRNPGELREAEFWHHNESGRAVGAAAELFFQPLLRP